MNNERALSLFTVQCSIVISSGSEVMRRALRGISDWADLQWSLLYRALEAVAPRARGKLLDVGCGDEQVECIFRPDVDEYLGSERERTFESTAVNLARSCPDSLYAGD